MFATKLAGVAGALLLAFAVTPVSAQTSTSGSAATSGTTSATEPQSGTTSGPAAGTPTTLGTSGNTTATPHQQSGIKDQSSSVTKEQEHGAGSGSSQAPQGPAVGTAGAEGNKNGPAPEKAEKKE